MIVKHKLTGEEVKELKKEATKYVKKNFGDVIKQLAKE